MIRHCQPSSYSPVASRASYPLRVLNAAANTYLRLALIAGTPPMGVDLSNKSPSVQYLHLTVISRDDPFLAFRRTEGALTAWFLSPGSRAEFGPADAPAGTVSLVSQFVDTGPAGDLVPFRVLATNRILCRTNPLHSRVSRLQRRRNMGKSNRAL